MKYEFKFCSKDDVVEKARKSIYSDLLDELEKSSEEVLYCECSSDREATNLATSIRNAVKKEGRKLLVKQRKSNVYIIKED